MADFPSPADELASARLLDARLRAAIARLEDLPENQSGSDRTALEEAIEQMRGHYRDAVRVR